MAYFAERTVPGPTLTALNDPKHFGLADRYNVSKLISLFLAREIAPLPLAKDVVVNVVHAGLCESGLRDDLPWPLP